MKNRRVVLSIILLVLAVLLVVFLVVGVPLIRDTFTPPITGLPPTSAGNSLQARFTQTALAKTAIANATPTTAQ